MTTLDEMKKAMRQSNPTPTPTPTIASPDGLTASPGYQRSILEASFNDTLTRAGDVTDSSRYFFIDITQLTGAMGNFFTEKVGPGNSIAQTIADVINRLATTHPAVTPVVRFLVGRDIQSEVSWSDLAKAYADMFWPNGAPLVTNKKAVIYVAYYAPNFQPTGDTAKGRANEIAPMIGTIGDHLRGIWNTFGGLLKVKNPDLSAAIVAVNSTTLMTGGGNFWSQYQANAHGIVDMQAKVKGDAAISAHPYCDYLWYTQKLEDRSDTRSVMGTTNLASQTKPTDKQWYDNTAAPLFNRTPEAKEGIQVLTAAKLGDWFGPMYHIDYPVQLIDATRDLVLNIVWKIGATTKPDTMASFFKPAFNKLLTAVADSNTEMQARMKNLRITPAAWASRIARNTAIKSAKKSIHISTEMFADFLMDGASEWEKLVKNVNGKDDANSAIKLSWDGHLWGYDKTKISEYKTRLKDVMSCMFPEMNANDISKLVGTKFRMRRILGGNSNSGGVHFNHCRTICTDRKLLYVGSDNTYPSYNEEHGIWVDDATAISNWYSGFWDTMWKKSDHDAHAADD
ncbi:hypothetical protein B0H63DRAFT_528836 [Podospora didyma]|uniref:PLD phosphodiesterase domain-containing protein n=1 Tax=Podospora didyma TaxID=330526 RepID=A0AAE0N2G6_9PEZI|nr:hypothetical protein B0H63DRAFT_528836 [Podospora didyma]